MYVRMSLHLYTHALFASHAGVFVRRTPVGISRRLL